ncbi:MAG: hypothetical protein K9M81_04580, partial [Chthoniobacterales bacterium]|nr:hypothetical protein [Chthoniobacterales bacterium]
MEVENSSKVTRERSLNVKEALTGDRPIRFFGTKIERDFSSNGNWLIRKIYDSIVYVIGSLYASISSFVNYFRSSTAENPIEAHVTDATNTKGDSSSVNIQQVHDSENKEANLFENKNQQIARPQTIIEQQAPNNTQQASTTFSNETDSSITHHLAVSMTPEEEKFQDNETVEKIQSDPSIIPHRRDTILLEYLKSDLHLSTLTEEQKNNLLRGETVVQKIEPIPSQTLSTYKISQIIKTQCPIIDILLELWTPKTQQKNNGLVVGKIVEFKAPKTKKVSCEFYQKRRSLVQFNLEYKILKVSQDVYSINSELSKSSAFLAAATINYVIRKVSENEVLLTVLVNIQPGWFAKSLLTDSKIEPMAKALNEQTFNSLRNMGPS